MSETQRYAVFPATKWTIIQRAAGSESPGSQTALEDLCRAYWPPLYAFLRRSGHGPHEAQDLVQGYLARLIQRKDLGAVAPEQGRFRAYLISGLRNFIVSEVRHDKAQKRGGDLAIVSFDTDEAEALCGTVLATDYTPDYAFDRRWAESLLDRAIEALRQEYVARGKIDFYEILKPSLTGAEGNYHSAWGQELGMTAGAVAVAVHRLRLRLRELVRLEVAQTVSSPEALDEEMHNLLNILSA